MLTLCNNCGSGNAFALFLKSQRKWTDPPLDLNNAMQFRALCNEHQFDAMKYVCYPVSYLLVSIYP